jgi:PGF-CTERM protein
VTQINVPEGSEDTPATVRMRVSSERIEAIGAEPEDLRVNRFDDEAGEWQGLPSEVTEVDGTIVVEGETPGFSYFSVSAVSEPEAAIDAPAEIDAGTEITLDASASSTEYGEIVAYEWRVDGDTLDGETATTTLDSAGEYEIELTVENDAAETDTVTETVTVVEAEADGEDGADQAPDGDGESTTGDGADGEEPTDEPAELPGFGAAVALIALLAAALIARKRHN